MALGSYIPLYAWVIEQMMADRHEQELLLLMAIAKHCDPYGLCYPGRITLMKLRHCSQKTYEKRLSVLLDCDYVHVIETYDYRRRQAQFDFQVSPLVLYVRPEIQDYCLSVFNGGDRDFNAEKIFLEILLRTKESQPETEPEAVNQNQKPEPGTSPITRHHNQLSTASTQKEQTQGSTMRNGAKPEPEQRDSATQRRPAPTEKEPMFRSADEFAALLSPTVDDGRIVNEIMLGVGTTSHQARQALETFGREAVVHWLHMAVVRRAKGELSRPGGWFFKMLNTHVPPLNTPEPGNSDSSNHQISDNEEF